MSATPRNPPSPSSSFFALELALETVALARPWVFKLRRHDRELFEQTRRALTRCVLGLGEGAKRDGGNRQMAFRRARGEANEALTAIRLAVVWGYLAEDEVVSLLAKLNHLVAVLVRLTR